MKSSKGFTLFELLFCIILGVSLMVIGISVFNALTAPSAKEILHEDAKARNYFMGDCLNDGKTNFECTQLANEEDRRERATRALEQQAQWVD